ncbi:unnamed protein product [Meganyctiphanes norvegica]|uniref:Protein kinase domain-containing protein n=1 Tax=Meganyctiphanes norvegica TaxID=48144 RepID=A0AAV2R1I4_MEGNR
MTNKIEITQNHLEEWDIVKELEDGQFGKVYKAKHKTKEHLASLTILHLHEEDNPEDLCRELKNIAKLNHENILTIFNYYHIEESFWLFIEYLSECSLKLVMTLLGRPFSEIQITYISKSLCKALAYLHDFDIAHCGIKSNSLLLTSDGRIVLSGVEVSTLNKITNTKKGTYIGSPHWLPPELLSSKSLIELMETSVKSDIWSFGITLIELAQMFPPNHKMSHFKIMQKIQKSDPPTLRYPSKFTEGFKSFIAKCLAKDPLIRPSAKDLINNAFLDCSFNENPVKDLYHETIPHNDGEILSSDDKENENQLNVPNDKPRKTSLTYMTLKGND